MSAAAIGGADLDLVEPVEHVELGQRDAVDAADLDRLAHHHRVEPAAAARPAGDDAELAAAFAEGLADLVRQLGRERAAADPGRVGLGDAEHKADGARRDPRPGRGLPRERVRRGHERIGAVIDIEHRALRAFEQDAAALAPRLVEQPPHRLGIGQDARRDRAQLGEQLAAVDLRLVEPAQQRVVVQQQRFEPRLRAPRVGEVADPDRPAPDLVLIGGTDAATGGADAAGRRGAPRGRGRARRATAGSAPRCRRASDCPALTSTPFSRIASISSINAQGSTTTPLPMIDNLPGRTTPDGSRLSLYSTLPMTSVWPAL